jgi:hypothetical protein
MIVCVESFSNVLSQKAILGQAIKTIVGHLHHLPSVKPHPFLS